MILVLNAYYIIHIVISAPHAKEKGKLNLKMAVLFFVNAMLEKC